MEENMNEIWKDIPGYEGLYQVSNMGRVKSLPKEWIVGKGGRRKHNGKILKEVYQRGYKVYSLYNNGDRVIKPGHQLVTMAFLGHVPDGYKRVVDHKNNNPLDNRLDNLQVISPRENSSKDRKGISKYTGVCWHKPNSKWIVKIGINGRKIHLGCFDDEERAGMHYQLALSNINKFDGDAKSFRDYLKSIS